MTPEELLKPRYKVIADYPKSDFKVHQIVEFSKIYPFSGLTFLQDDTAYAPEYFSHYPHLFKKLEWWEEREESEMPEYVTNSHVKEGHHFIRKTGVFKVIDKGSYSDFNIEGRYSRHASPFFCYIEGNKDGFNYSNFLPATEEEYLNQQKTI